MLSVELGVDLRYHAVTVFEDDLISAADSVNTDYGGATVMLMTMNKFRPNVESVDVIKDHVTNTPTVLRVMHGGLQVPGQCETFLT